MRCFIAIELDAAVRRGLNKWLRDRPSIRDVRWATSEQLHLTCKFLGDTPDALIPRVCDVMRDTAARIEPFALRFAGLGCFPLRGRPRVLWWGVEDVDERCDAWLTTADPLLAELGFEREQRRLTPHLTLARSKSARGGDTFAEMVKRASPPAPAKMRVEQLTLFESRLRPGGVVYRSLATAPLGSS